MGKQKATGISWCHYSWTSHWGCQEVSPACDNCYARRLSELWGYKEGGAHFKIWGKDEPRRFFTDKHWAQLRRWNEEAKQARERRRVFVNSMSDTFEDRRDLDPIRQRLWIEIAACPWLDFLLLTKRPQNFRRMLPAAWLENPQPNVWGMTTVESQDYLWRAEALANTPLAIRGISAEPLLGPLVLPERLLHPDRPSERIHWIITGGESGTLARPSHPQWFKSLRDQSYEAAIAFHHKQWGEWSPTGPVKAPEITVCGDCGWIGPCNSNEMSAHVDAKHSGRIDCPPVQIMRRVGVKAAGRLLDGRLWNEFPVSQAQRDLDLENQRIIQDRIDRLTPEEFFAGKP